MYEKRRCIYLTLNGRCVDKNARVNKGCLSGKRNCYLIDTHIRDGIFAPEKCQNASCPRWN